MRDFGSIDEMPLEIREPLGPGVADIRAIFINPRISADYSVEFAPPNREGILEFLCDEREFSRERVKGALERAFR